jgi:hypothetical protein
LDQESNEAIATERARWFSELSAAIDQAQKLAWRLGVSEGDSAEAMELYARLEAVREEVDALRRGGWAGEQSQLEPFWMNLLPWRPQPVGAGD